MPTPMDHTKPEDREHAILNLKNVRDEDKTIWVNEYAEEINKWLDGRGPNDFIVVHRMMNMHWHVMSICIQDVVTVQEAS